MESPYFEGGILLREKQHAYTRTRDTMTDNKILMNTVTLQESATNNLYLGCEPRPSYWDGYYTPLLRQFWFEEEHGAGWAYKPPPHVWERTTVLAPTKDHVTLKDGCAWRKVRSKKDRTVQTALVASGPRRPLHMYKGRADNTALKLDNILRFLATTGVARPLFGTAWLIHVQSAMQRAKQNPVQSMTRVPSGIDKPGRQMGKRLIMDTQAWFYSTPPSAERSMVPWRYTTHSTAWVPTHGPSLIGRYFKLPPMQDALVSSMESLFILFYHALKARNTTERLMALTIYAKCARETIDLDGLTWVAIMAAWDYFCPDAEMQVQAFTTPSFEDCRSFLDKYDMIKQAPIFSKLYEFSMYMMAHTMFASVGTKLDFLNFKKISQEALKKKYHLGPDFVYCILDTSLFLCERGYQSYQTGSISPIFHSEEKYQAWFDEAERLIRQAHFLSNPEVHGIDRFGYLSDLKSAIEKGQSMRKCSLKKDERLVISRLLSSMELTHDLELTKRAAQKDRKTPACFLLYGGSSIGKSTLQNVMFQHYGKRRGLQTTSDFRYIRNPTEEFWSGMNSTQWCIFMDDIAFMSPKLGEMDPSLAEMLCVANNVPFVPAQAELSDKGRTPVRAELVIGSTNTEDLNLVAYFSCPLAVQRRFPWIIDAQVHPNYEDPSRPGMLDSSRVPVLAAGEYPDYWTFTIKRVEPKGTERKHQMGFAKEVLKCANMKEFLKWYNGVIDNHNLVQDQVMKSFDQVHSTNVCPTCAMPSNWCECMQPQALEDSGDGDFVGREIVPSYFHFEPVEPNLAPTTPQEYLSELTGVEYVVCWFYAILHRLSTMPFVGFFLALLLGDGWVARWAWGSRYRWTLGRNIVRYAGVRVQAKIGNPKVLGAIAVGIVAAFATYKATGTISSYFKTDKKKVVTEQSDYAELEKMGKAPEPDTNPIVRPSFADPFPFSNTDLSQTTLCSKGASGDLLKKHIIKATVHVRSHVGNATWATTGVNVRGNIYMVNNHGIAPSTPFYMDIIGTQQGTMSTSMKNLLITEGMLLRVPDHDLAFILLKVRPPGTNLVEYFCKKAYTAKVDGVYYGRGVDGVAWELDVKNLQIERTTWSSHALAVTQDVWLGHAASPTAVGDCGSLLVSNTPKGWTILGIHTLGKDDRAGAMKVPYELLKDCCDKLQQEFVSRGRVEISAPSAQRILGPLNPQSVTHRGIPGVADILGSFDGFRQRAKTNVTETLLAPHLLEHGYGVSRTRPDMTRKPWELALNDTTRPVVLLNNDILAEAKEMFICETTMKNYSTIHVYPLHVAINGVDGLEYCDKMNRKSSAGAPYMKSKSNFMFFINEETSTDMDVVPEIKQTIADMIATYKRGERVHTVYCGHLKDEPVTFEKASAGKTRVFTASGMAYTLVVRMHLLSVIVYLQKNRFTFETGPGTVVQSLEWEAIREHLVQFGEDRIVAGDYSKFDKRMPANVILAAFEIIEDICRKAGYGDDELRVVRGIAYDTAFPTVDFNGDLIEFFGSNPSGHPLTVIINGLVNSLYMRYCFIVLRPLKSASFKDTVALMTYGDDNIMGVAKTADWFNHTAIQRVLGDVDIGYTMADKAATSVPFIPLSGANFLKREWRWDEELDAYVAPLDPTSIEKMLMVCVAKPNIGREQHAVQVVSTAVREYFWYGRAVFVEKTRLLKEVIARANLDQYCDASTFPSWEELQNDFETRSRHVRLQRQRSARLVNDTTIGSTSKPQQPKENVNHLGGLATLPSKPLAFKTQAEVVDRRIGQSCAARLDVLPGRAPVGLSDLEPQASVTMGTSDATTASTQETVTFHDVDTGSTGGLAMGYDGVSATDQTENVDLVNFLSRPVRIANFTWSESDGVGTARTFNPWNLFFTDARIKYKLNNFAFIQCSLKVKVMINASPFYYGRMLMTYQPLPAFTPSTIVQDAGTRYFIPLSQRPHIWLEPQHNSGGTMDLPFIYFQNFLNAQSASAMTNMGQLNFTNYTTLQSANGVTGQGVTVSIYAWAENVKLSGPSVGLAVQSDHLEVQADEYGNGAVSGPASAIASGARWFEDIPIISRFATATRIGASAVSSIASMFGFTNVPVISDTQPLRPSPFPNMSSSEIGFPVEKLTLDPKNELTVDPSILGLPSTDELVIANLVTKTSYLTTSTWTTANAVDDILFSSRVNPMMYDNDASANAKVYLTPMCWVASMFNAWRGDIIFTFKVVASPFHKGRLRVSFDPSAYTGQNLVTDSASSNVVFTEILDLADASEVELTVPYQQATSFLANRAGLTIPGINWSTSVSPSFSYDSRYDNGFLTVRVLNNLTAPVAAAPVAMIVSVKAGKNFQVANPRDLPLTSTFQVQADAYSGDEPVVSNVLGTGAMNHCDEQYLINFGEHITSLRQVLRRMSHVSTSTWANSALDLVILKKQFSKIPGMVGYDPNGINSAKGLIVTASNFPYNYSQPHPLTWLLPAFLCYRGSTHWTFNVTAPTAVGHIRAYRVNVAGGTAGETVTSQAKGTRSADAKFFADTCDAGSSGQALTSQFTNAGLSVSCPNYSVYRFQSTNPTYYTAPSTGDGSLLDQYQVEIFANGNKGVASDGMALWSYASIGTDFGMYFFINVPTFYLLSASPPAN